MSWWNYRVVQSSDLCEYFIAEVYYHDEGKLGYVDDSRDYLRWNTIDDLRNADDDIQKAFDKPILRVGEGGRLVDGCI